MKHTDIGRPLGQAFPDSIGYFFAGPQPECASNDSKFNEVTQLKPENNNGKSLVPNLV